VPVVAFHGTADPVDPYVGHGQKYWTYSVPSAAKRWARHDKCPGAGLTSGVAATVVLSTYAPCSGGSAVELYSIVGEGHEWPGGPNLGEGITKALGPQSSAINANNIMWSFFVAHPLP
jgi:polyhydroxybutyrate depolymerase